MVERAAEISAEHDSGGAGVSAGGHDPAVAARGHGTQSQAGRGRRRQAEL